MRLSPSQLLFVLAVHSCRGRGMTGAERRRRAFTRATADSCARLQLVDIAPDGRWRLGSRGALLIAGYNAGVVAATNALPDPRMAGGVDVAGYHQEAVRRLVGRRP